MTVCPICQRRIWPWTSVLPYSPGGVRAGHKQCVMFANRLHQNAINQGWQEATASGVIPAEALARSFHFAYEELAPNFGYETREGSRVPWDQVPSSNKELMVATAAKVIQLHHIRSGR